MSSKGRVLAAVAAAAFSFGYGFFALIVLPQIAPEAMKALGLTDHALAWVHGGTFLAAAVGGVFFGRLADRGRRALALAASVALPALGLVGAALAEDGVALALARLVTGFGVGGGWGVAHASIAAIVSPARRTLASACVQAMAPLGNVGAVCVGFGLDLATEWRTALWRAASLGLLAPFVYRAARAAESSTPPTPPRELRAIFADVPLKPYLLLSASLALHMAAFWLFYAWIPQWFRHELGRPASASVAFQLWLCVGFFAGDLFFAPLSRALGLTRAFLFGSVVFGVGIAAVPYTLRLFDATPALGASLLIATGAGSGLWAAFGPLFARHVPEASRATASSAAYQLSRAAQLVLQPLVPVIAGSGGGYGAVFLVAASAALLGGVVVPLLPRTRNEAHDPGKVLKPG